MSKKRMPSKEDWNFRGNLFIVLEKEIKKPINLPGVEVIGKEIRIKNGRLKITKHGPLIYAGDTPFNCNRNNIRCIRDYASASLWTNPDKMKDIEKEN